MRQMNYILYINTKDQKSVEVKLKLENQVVAQRAAHNEYGSQVLLPLINTILEENNLRFSDLTGVEVEIGPGSFVGLRVGVSVANALGYTLNIPVNGKKTEMELSY